MKRKIVSALLAAGMLLAMASDAWATEVSHDENGIYMVGDNYELTLRHCRYKAYTKDVTELFEDVDGEPIATIPGDVELFNVGYHRDWSMVQIDGVNYLVKGRTLTAKKPENQTDWQLTFEDPVPEFNGYYGTAYITAYCPGSCCCGQWAGSHTSSGTVPTAGRTVACNDLPAGTHIYIEGMGEYIVEDTGWSPYSPWIDVFFNTHAEAEQFGMQMREVWIA